MTHDPLCPYTPQRNIPCDHQPFDSASSCAVLHFTPEMPCQCDLIAKVRKDERNRHLTYVVNVSLTGPDDDAALEKIKHILAPRMVVNVVGTRSDFV